jgi:hypothetical protein
MFICCATTIVSEPRRMVLGLKEDDEPRSNRSFRANTYWIEVYRRWVNIPYWLHFNQSRGLSVSTNDTDGNNSDSPHGCLEDRLQTHQLNIRVLHRGTGNELRRHHLKRRLNRLQVSGFLLCPAPQLWACWQTCFLG